MISLLRGSFLASVFFVLPFSVQAATTSTAPATPVYDVRITSDNISYAPARPLLGNTVRIYATVENKGTEDVEGLVRFFDGEQFIGGKLFSLRAANRPEDTWIVWKPTATGTHTIRIEAVNDTAFPDDMPIDNKASVTITVEPDTDGDGIADADDPDADNDGLTNTQEAQKKTDPLNPDTDGDKVGDKTDAFPLDPKRTVAPPPAPKPKPAPTPVVKPAVKPAATDTPAVIAPTSTEPIIVLPTTSTESIVSSTESEVPIVEPTETVTDSAPPSERSSGESNTIYLLIGLGILTTLIGAGALISERMTREKRSS